MLVIYKARYPLSLSVTGQLHPTKYRPIITINLTLILTPFPPCFNETDSYCLVIRYIDIRIRILRKIDVFIIASDDAIEIIVL